MLQGAGQVSPDEMPVPQWDEASELQVEQMLSPRALSGGRREMFQTPSSWSYPWRGGMRGLRSEGALPDGDRQGVRSQGELREERRSQGPIPERVMRDTTATLEREVEKELVEKLMEENEKLRASLRVAQMRGTEVGSAGSWETVGAQATRREEPERRVRREPSVPSPVRMRPRSRTPTRFTPNGTQIPPGRPPLDQGEDQHGDWVMEPRGSARNEGGWVKVDQGREGEAQGPDHGAGDRAGHRAEHGGDYRQRRESGPLSAGHRAWHGGEGQRYPEGGLPDARHRAWHGGEPQQYLEGGRGDLRHRAPQAGEDHQRALLPGPPGRDSVPGLRGGRVPAAEHGRGWEEGGSREMERRLQVSTVENHEQRVSWLERELKSLQEVLEQHRSPGTSEYWGAPPPMPPVEPSPPPPPPLPVGASGRRGREEMEDEALRSVPITFPKLPEATSKTAALEAGDWLAQLAPLVGDVSQKAAAWWSRVMELCMGLYKSWLTATPLERLHMEVPTVEQASPGQQRLDQRVTALLLAALPEALKQELVAARQLHSAAILLRVLKTYQPGGQAEKASTLAAVTQTSPAATATEAVEQLRLWRRQVLRAKELQVVLPDSTLQVRALDRIMMQLLTKNDQASFRVSAFRMTYQVDVQPSETTVGYLYDILMAEAEQMRLMGEHGAKEKEEKGLPTVKKLGTTQHQGGEVGKCRGWGTEAGCRFANRCRFLHDDLQDQKNRCFACSSTQHRRAECPHVREDLSAGATGGSGAGLHEGQGGAQGSKPGIEKAGTKGKGKGKKGKEGGKKPVYQGKKEDEGARPQVAKAEAEEDLGAAKPSATMGTATSGTGEQSGELMQEVTSLLKSLRVNPNIRAVSVKAIREGRFEETLLDGGATHCLRQARSEKEWNQAKPIEVQLAAGSVEMRIDEATGTLLSRTPVQPLIPVSKLAEVGYRLQWSKDECRFEHPKHGTLPTRLHQGCPVVVGDKGKELMIEVEQASQRRARLRAVLECGMLAETKEEKVTAGLKGLFPEVPDEILEKVVGREDWEATRLPFNRRRRRQIEQAQRVVIHVFAGGDVNKWKVAETKGTIVVCLDLLHGANLLCAHVSGWIDHLIDSGKVVMWLGGPPCRSVSVCRTAGDGGPPPVRSREGPQRFALEGLSPWYREQAFDDAALWLKNLRWMMRVQAANGRAEVMVEQPRDPEEWKDRAKGQPPYPTFLSWPETRMVKKHLGMTEVRLDQGALGHRTVKPTTILTTIPEVQVLDGLRATHRRGQWPEELEERVEYSKSLAAWAPGLVGALHKAIWRKTQELGLECSVGGDPELRPLSTKEKEDVVMWQRHFDAGHVPYRRDCEVCLQALGKDRPRRRLACPESYCLSVDLAGPFGQGVDQKVRVAKYFMTAVATVPMDSEGPMVEGLRRLGYKIKAEEEGLEEPERIMEWEDGEDPMSEGVVKVHEIPEAELQAGEEALRRWQQYLADRAAVKVRMITMAVPVRSRKAKDVLEALGEVYSRYRAMQVPIIRVHTDRAREFSGGEFRAWIQRRDLYHTMSAGDEPQGNGRVEAELGLIKGRVRALLKASKAPLHFWPHAVRQAGEERMRQQLRALGIHSPPLVPFGADVVVKKKTWFSRGEPWRWPMQKARCWGPAGDMSLTSKGHYAQTECGTWVRTTVVVAPTMTQEQWEKRAADMQDAGKVIIVEPDEGKRADEEPRRHRVVGKSGPSAYFGYPDTPEQPSLHAIREGGECNENEMQGEDPQEEDLQETHYEDKPDIYYDEATEGDEVYEAVMWGNDEDGGDKGKSGEIEGEIQRSHEVVEEATRKRQEELRREGEQRIGLWQHQVMQEMIREEVVRLQEGQLDVQAVLDAKSLAGEIRRLETELGPKVRQLEAQEIGQTRTVPLEEVKENLQDWVEAFRKEVNTLTNGPVERMSAQEFTRLQGAGAQIEVLPMMAVATIKPGKYKGRVVVCGNHTQTRAHDDISVGGACTVAVRSLISKAAQSSWALSTIDVTGAFLQAPRRGKGVTTIVKPPALLTQMGLTEEGEVWKVGCALYGFVESPSDWAAYRDQGLRAMKWSMTDGRMARLEATAERHVWKAVDPDGSTFAYIAVYVDDMLVGGVPEEVEPIMGAIQKTWTCSAPEPVTASGWVKFCGYELQEREQGGFNLRQLGYINEILNRRGIEGTEIQPLFKVEEGEDEENVPISVVREAQALTGELLWVTSRTRPDLAYGVGIMSRMIHRRPSYVVQMGRYMMKYLRGTKEQMLEYRPAEGRDLEVLTVYVDTSFAPPHEQFRSVHGILLEHAGTPLMWESTRQSFIAQSTAEAELLGFNEAFQAGESMAAMLQVMGYQTRQVLYGDNKAALAQCNHDTGPWRTRHLRLRSAKLREALHQEDAKWQAKHMSGAELVADGLTKPLQGQGFQRFRDKLCLVGQRAKAAIKKVMEAGEDAAARKAEEHQRWIERAMLALAATGGALVAAGQVEMGCAVLVGLFGGHALLQRKRPSAEMGGPVPTVRALRVKVDVSVDPDQDQQPVLPRGESRGSGDPPRQGGYVGEAGTPTPWVELEAVEPARPWRNAEYLCPPGVGQDRWDLSRWAEGWVIRSHGKGRKQSFDPRRSAMPCEERQLTGRRVTLVVAGREPEVIEDDFTTSRGWAEKEMWRGYTFLEVRRDLATERAREGTRAPRVASSSASQPSYEFVNE